MFTHIVVPLDGSSFGEAALTPALGVARRTGARLTLVTVQDPWTEAPAELNYEGRERYLERIIRHRGPAGSPLSASVRSGHPADQILQEAEGSGASLIVMSTHGRGGVSRVWLGSIADQCLRHTRVPMLLTRPRPGAGSTEESFLPNRVVVPLDGTEGAERALAPAIEMARVFGISILLLRVVTEQRAAASGPAGGGPVPEAARAAEYLDGVARRLWGLGLPATTRVIVDRPAAEAIIAEGSSDLVVMSSHARSPISRAFLGSVSDKVVRGGRGAVLLVPPHASVPDAGTPELPDEGARAQTPASGPLPSAAR
jgi:nucleotide-binding universal stress UspA family protein